MIKIIDNFFSEDIRNKLLIYCANASYKFNAVDRLGDLPTGSEFIINKKNPLYIFLDKNLKNKFKKLKNLSCYKAQINCFIPRERPSFHVDNKEGEGGFTCLYYPNDFWNKDEGGETQFLINGEIRGILPIPNRMIIFDSTLDHAATSYKTYHRFTIALKYI